MSKKWKTFDGFFSQRYGRNMGTLASILLLLAMLGFSAAYIKSLILLFHPILPFVQPWILSAGLLSIVFVMSLRGGLIEIIHTDVLSLVLRLLFFPLMAFFMWNTPQGSSSLTPLSLTEGQIILPSSFIFSLILLNMFTYILAPSYGQKIFAAKSPKVAYWSVISAAILVFILYGAAIFATALFRSKGFECQTPEQALPTLAQWLYEEWHPYDTSLTKEKLIGAFTKRINDSRIPLTVVVLKNDMPIGTISLKREKAPEFSDFPDNSIWMGSLQVIQDERNRGLGQELLKFAQIIAKQFGYKDLYFYTSNRY